MRKMKKFLYNTILMTITTFLIHIITLIFQIYLSNKIGAAGIGLYQLIMSVYTFGITFATSGVKIAVIRLVSGEMGKNNNSGVRKSIRAGIIYSLFFGICAMIILYFISDFVAVKYLLNASAIKPLKTLAFTLPFLSIASALSGYFTAVHKIAKLAVIQVFEQVIRIIITIMCFAHMQSDMELSCMAIVMGSLVSEVISCIIIYIIYKSDIRRFKDDSRFDKHIPKKIVGTAMPLAVSSYARSGLSTVQHLLIPRGLKKSGSSGMGAIATYGRIHGMVFPLIFFPSALINVIAELLVPELAEYQARREYKKIDYVVNKVFQLSLLFTVLIAGIFFFYSDEIGALVYKDALGGTYIKIFAPLILAMYTDNVVDGMLKGLGYQVSSMRFNILDSLVGVILIYFLVPTFAINGYIITVIITELFNFLLSVNKLTRICNFRINVIKNLLVPLICIIFSCEISRIIFMPAIENHFAYAAFNFIAVCILYFAALRISGYITKYDIASFKDLFHRKI